MACGKRVRDNSPFLLQRVRGFQQFLKLLWWIPSFQHALKYRVRVCLRPRFAQRLLIIEPDVHYNSMLRRKSEKQPIPSMKLSPETNACLTSPRCFLV